MVGGVFPFFGYLSLLKLLVQKCFQECFQGLRDNFQFFDKILFLVIIIGDLKYFDTIFNAVKSTVLLNVIEKICK